MTEDARRARLARRLVAAPTARAALTLARADASRCDLTLSRALLALLAESLSRKPASAPAIVRALKAVAAAGGLGVLRALAASAEGATEHLRGRMSAARRAYREAARLHERAGSPLDASDAWRALIVVEKDAGRPTAARAAHEKASRLLGRRTEPLRRAQILMNLGNAHHHADAHAEALAAYERARRLLEPLGDVGRLASCDYNSANIHWTRDEVARARELYERARSGFERIHATALVVQCEQALGGLDVAEGRLDEGLARLRAARDAARALGDSTGVARAELDAADALLRLNRPAEAAQAATIARRFFGRQQPGGAADAESARAGAALQEGRPRTAARLFARAAAERLRMGNRVAAALAEVGRASALVRTGDDAAIAPARRAAVLLERRGLASRAARARSVLAEGLLASGDVAGAAKEARRAITLARGRDPRVEMAGLLALARAEGARSRGSSAHAHLLDAAKLVERMRLGVTSEESLLSFALDKSEVFEALVANRLAVGTPGAVREALLHAERGKARALAERLARSSRGGRAWSRGADTPARRAVLRRLEALDRELARAESRLEAPGDGQGLRSRHEATLRRLLAERARLMTSVGRTSPRELLALGAAGVDPWAGIAALQPGEIALEFAQSGDRLHLFVIQDDRVEAHEGIASVAEVADLVDRLGFLLGKGVLGEHQSPQAAAFVEPSVARRLEQLFDALLAPVAARLVKRHVRVVPHGLLHGIPFQALQHRGVPLVETCIVSHAPSLAVLGLLASETRAGLEPPLVLGVPDAAAPEIEAEVEAVSRHVGMARVFRGAEATVEALHLAENRPSVLHVACHGLFSGPEGGGALRLGDAWISLPQLEMLRGTGELVVLSGCETGRGIAHAGDEWVGLVRAFLLAGARCVVASLWEVHDRSTAELMNDFYAHFGAGRSVGESLALAQRAARRRGAPVLHWAPFVAVGDPSLRLRAARAA